MNKPVAVAHSGRDLQIFVNFLTSGTKSGRCAGVTFVKGVRLGAMQFLVIQENNSSNKNPQKRKKKMLSALQFKGSNVSLS